MSSQFIPVDGQKDYLLEEGDVVDSIYEIEEQYKKEASSPNPDEMKLLKLMNQQLMRGLLLQQYR